MLKSWKNPASVSPDPNFEANLLLRYEATRQTQLFVATFNPNGDKHLVPYAQWSDYGTVQFLSYCHELVSSLLKWLRMSISYVLQVQTVLKYSVPADLSLTKGQIPVVFDRQLCYEEALHNLTSLPYSVRLHHEEIISKASK